MTRLALRYGITAFDTAPHYHPSEIILGKCLYALKDEFPRDKYSIITKCGKYSPRKEDHVLDEDLLRACVERSLKRFKTDYLDVICELTWCVRLLSQGDTEGNEDSLTQTFTTPSSTRLSPRLQVILPEPWIPARITTQSTLSPVVWSQRSGERQEVKETKRSSRPSRC